MLEHVPSAGILIHSLAFFLLAKIFVHCQESPSELENIASAIILSHVSKRWRTVAISTHELWTHIPATHLPHPALQEIILRSGNCGLFIEYFQLPNLSGPLRHLNEQLRIRDTIFLLRPHCSRWITLSISANAKSIEAITQLVICIPLPRLRCLNLIQTDRTTSYHGPFIIDPDVFSTLRLHRTSVYAGGASHFRNLKSLELHDTSCSMIDQAALNMISQMNVPGNPPTMLNLHQLTIISAIPVFPVSPSFHPSSLVSLTLGGFMPSSQELATLFIQFFNGISSANLLHLELNDMLGFAWDAFVTSLYSTAIPKYPGLQSLMLKSLELRSFDIRFADAFPAITALELIDVDPTPLVSFLQSGYPGWKNVNILVNGVVGF